MSTTANATPPAAAASNSSKKAVHVKWAGKTIALGTFPAAEADEKCAKAKALTRAWRSSMRPKPSREWVMVELERLGVRVVSGRLGRKAGEDGDDVPSSEGKKGHAAAAAAAASLTGGLSRTNSLGWGSEADLTNILSRRNSSLGLSMMNETMGRRGSLGSLGQLIGMDAGDPTMPPHRPFVGGGAAAAFEAARHDHFAQKASAEQQRRASLGLGGLGAGGMSGMGMSVNPNQHYEMLKLHHMNLLNEIQETTLMMNLYQQQQLQQQQQQLQQQAAAADLSNGGANDAQLSMLMQQQSAGSAGGSMDPLFGASQLRRASLGLGGAQFGAGAGGNFGAPPAAASSSAVAAPTSSSTTGATETAKEPAAKEDAAAPAATGAATVDPSTSSSTAKRSAEDAGGNGDDKDEEEGSPAKRSKTED